MAPSQWDSINRPGWFKRPGWFQRRTLWLLTTLMAPTAVFMVPGAGTAEPAVETRYPFDPACPWGRLANGKGMITRCLSEDEARALLSGGTISARTGTVPVQATQESTPASSAPAAATPQPAAQPATQPAAQPATPSRPVRVEVGPIIADDGQISIGQLGKPVDRYRACVEKHGGLSATSGEVHVHFLVRGERSRAEGVEVAKYSGVSKKAAQCIADVVDRRATGTPSLPMLGATLVFKLSS